VAVENNRNAPAAMSRWRYTLNLANANGNCIGDASFQSVGKR
jgi:hypothetical protein